MVCLCDSIYWLLDFCMYTIMLNKINIFKIVFYYINRYSNKALFGGKTKLTHIHWSSSKAVDEERVYSSTWLHLEVKWRSNKWKQKSHLWNVQGAECYSGYKGQVDLPEQYPKVGKTLQLLGPSHTDLGQQFSQWWRNSWKNSGN